MTSAVHPLPPDRWDDLVDLFGPTRGACAGCWCMWPRLRGVDFKALPKEARREAFEAIVNAGPPPGLLLYENEIPIGWVAISPRRAVHRFNIAKVSAPADPLSADLERTWALTCFYARCGHRGQRLTTRLAEAAIAYAREQGAERIEVAAIDPDRPLVWGEGFVGIAAMLAPLGFREIDRRSPIRPLLRLEL